MPKYEEDAGFVVLVGDTCVHCGSEHTEYDRLYGYWKCEFCSTVWSSDYDDPDYDDLQEGERWMLKDRGEEDVNEEPLQNQPPNVSRVEERILEYFQTLPQERRRAVLDQLASENDLLNTPSTPTV